MKQMFTRLSLLVIVSVSSLSADDRTVLNGLFDQEMMARNVHHVRRKANQLPIAQRLDYLLGHVLHGEQLQLHVDFVDGSRLAVSPLLDLISAADELGRLDELDQKIRSLTPQTLQQQKSRAATLALIASRQKNNGKMRHAKMLTELDAFVSLATTSHPVSRPYRGPEALLYSQLKRFEAAREVLLPVVLSIVQRYRVANQWTTWQRQFRGVLGIANQTVSTTQWHPSTIVTAETLGEHLPQVQWLVEPGKVRNSVSHGDDYLYFSSPLTGNFQVECGVTAFGWADMRILADGTWVSPVYNHKDVEIGDVRKSHTRNPLVPQLCKISDNLHYRLQIQDDVVRTFVNGREVHAQPRKRHPDPWIALRSNFKDEGNAYNVRITGDPVIPHEVRIADHPDLEGWIGYFGGTVGWPDSRWQGLYKHHAVTRETAQEESSGGILATRTNQQEFPNVWQEEALFYHRPMMEDGTIEYEFFYRPDQIEACPALGRNCFLVAPEGIRVHRLTNGIHDRSGLAPDNISDSTPPLQRVALQAESWNTASLSVIGNSVRISINGQKCFDMQIDDQDQRNFGFFHYADQTELRVRNVKWAGDWPKTVPTVEAQFLATHDADVLDNDVKHMSASFEYDFARDGMDSERIEIIRRSAEEHFSVTPDGLLSVRSGTGGWRLATMAPKVSISGDFDIIVEYDQFDPEVQSGAANLMLVAKFDQKFNTEALLQRRFVGGGPRNEQLLQCATVEGAVGGEKRDYFFSRTHEERSGRLRLSRRGKVIHYLAAEGKSPNFRLLASREFTDAPLIPQGVRIINQIYKAGVSRVVWKSIQIRAESLSGEEDVLDERILALNGQREKLAQDVTYDFADSSIDFAKIYSWGAAANRTPGDEGLRFTHVGEQDWGSSGIATRQQFAGDFDCEVELEVLGIDPLKLEQPIEIYMQIEHVDEGRTQATAVYKLTNSGYQSLGAQKRSVKPGGGNEYTDIREIAVKRGVTHLRVARRGNLYYIIGQSADLKFPQILSVLELADDPADLKLLIHAGRVGHTAEMLVTQMRIAAESYKPK